MKLRLLELDSCTKRVGKEKFVTLHTDRCYKRIKELGVDASCFDVNGRFISSSECLAKVDVSDFHASENWQEKYSKERESLDKHVRFDESQDKNNDGFVGQYYLDVLNVDNNEQCKKACSNNKDCSNHRFSKFETCHMFETVQLCRQRVQHNACRCRTVDTKSCLNSTDPECERKLYKRCSDKLDVPKLDPCRKEETYMDDLPEGDAWVATKTCTTVDHRNCKQTKSNYLELLKKVISFDIEDDEIFFQNGNCVLFTNEMAVPQKGFIEETTNAIMGRRRNDRQAFGGTAPRGNRGRGGRGNRARDRPEVTDREATNRPTTESAGITSNVPSLSPRTVDATEIKDESSSSSSFMISLLSLLVFLAFAGTFILIMMPKRR